MWSGHVMSRCPAATRVAHRQRTCSRRVGIDAGPEAPPVPKQAAGRTGDGSPAQQAAARASDSDGPTGRS
jgi:hypothetical protein